MMHFSTKTLLLPCSVLSGAFVSANPIAPKSIAEVERLPFNFTELFTATLSLNAPSSYIRPSTVELSKF